MNPIIGFPLANEYTIWCSHLLLLDEGTKLVTGELVGETVNELGTAGVNGLVVTTDLKVFIDLSPAFEEHPEDVVCHEVVNPAALALDLCFDRLSNRVKVVQVIA